MGFKLREIADHLNGDLVGDGNVEIRSVAAIQEAGAGDITFVANNKYAKHLEETKASAVIVPSDLEGVGDIPLIRVDNPYYAFMKTVSLFHPPQPLLDKGIHETAVIGEDTTLGKEVAIGPYVVIGRRCKIGNGSVLIAGVVVGDDVIIGEGCVLHANVSLRNGVQLGNRVVLHDGVVVGSDGFGFAPEDGRYHKIPQIGSVVIEDDVEIGANSTIDRATLGETRIKRGAKLDNLIQVGHNCTIGEDTVIAAQTGLSGSTHIGKGVRIGGQVGFAGHLTVGNEVAIGAQSGVNKSIPDGQFVFGTPAKPHMEAFRIQGAINRLPRLLKDVKELKAQIKKLMKK